MSEPQHVPVLSERVVGLLAPALLAPGSVVVDATLGLGGHASALLAAAPQAHLEKDSFYFGGLIVFRQRLYQLGRALRELSSLVWCLSSIE